MKYQNILTIIYKEVSKIICDLYVNKYVISYISKNLGIGSKIVRNILVKNGFKIKIRRYKYIINQDYFVNIDLPEKAYILGLLGADGSIGNKQNSISISLKKEDAYLLYKINDLMGSNYCIRGFCDLKYYILIFSSFKIKQDLMKFGIMPNKTFKLRLIDLPDKFMFAFLRGYFDGDGYFYIDTRRKHKGNLAFVGNIDFCTDLKLFLERFDFHPKIYINKSHNKKIVELRIIRKAEISKLFDLMYKDNNICMSRKYLKIKEFVEKCNDCFV